MEGSVRKMQTPRVSMLYRLLSELYCVIPLDFVEQRDFIVEMGSLGVH